MFFVIIIETHVTTISTNIDDIACLLFHEFIKWILHLCIKSVINSRLKGISRKEEKYEMKKEGK